jgi:hypothetical protein
VETMVPTQAASVHKHVGHGQQRWAAIGGRRASKQGGGGQPPQGRAAHLQLPLLHSSRSSGIRVSYGDDLEAHSEPGARLGRHRTPSGK